MWIWCDVFCATGACTSIWACACIRTYTVYKVHDKVNFLVGYQGILITIHTLKLELNIENWQNWLVNNQTYPLLGQYDTHGCIQHNKKLVVCHSAYTYVTAYSCTGKNVMCAPSLNLALAAYIFGIYSVIMIQQLVWRCMSVEEYSSAS